ncbi:excitatory amino acid transporter-like [Xenia sp. Carnegie-2017]|uniref:excitatory amino acid transporter-like n=1 Tax=Xenia sp. Carnegie-2017 TaxID=2897299 RepID=UPI001F04217C|nr:excitatory amino acid transporter-like [Xenia sp. Carnegie-2017]
MKQAFKMIRSFSKFVLKNILFLLLLLGVILGIIIGISLNPVVKQSTKFTPKDCAMFIGFPGEIFLRMLMLVVVPFIASSVITSVTTIDKRAAASIGKRAAMYFWLTTAIGTGMAVTIGRIMIKSKAGESEEIDEDISSSTAGSSPVYAILDMLRNMVPDNILQASFASTGTKFATKVTSHKFLNVSTNWIRKSPENMSNFLNAETINPLSVSPESIVIIKDGNVMTEYAGQVKYPSPNLMGIVFLSIAFGIALSGLQMKGNPIADFFQCLLKVTTRLVDVLVWLSPIGVGSIIASNLAGMEDITGTTERLGMYLGALLITFVLHGFVVLPIIYAIIKRKNPFQLFRVISQALLMGLGTASSSVTIPVTLDSFQKNNLVEKNFARFLLPVGTITYVPTTAIYIALAAIFIIQTTHSNLMTITSCILICLSSTIATLAAPPIPASTPIAVQSVVLTIIGIPSADIGIIVATDWLIDRIATPINIWLNVIGCIVIENFSKDELQIIAFNKTSRKNSRISACSRNSVCSRNIVSGRVSASSVNEVCAGFSQVELANHLEQFVNKQESSSFKRRRKTSQGSVKFNLEPVEEVSENEEKHGTAVVNITEEGELCSKNSTNKTVTEDYENSVAITIEDEGDSACVNTVTSGDDMAGNCEVETEKPE